MVLISIKQYMTCPWPKCVHIHHTNMHFHTGNFCYVVVKVVQILISQVNIQISITQTHVLQYAFITGLRFALARIILSVLSGMTIPKLIGCKIARLSGKTTFKQSDKVWTNIVRKVSPRWYMQSNQNGYFCIA